MNDERLRIANAVLQDFAPDTRLFLDSGKCQTGGWWTVEWTTSRGKTITRRWITNKGNDFYPVWSRIWPRGGTACRALSQLVRWMQDKPVLLLATWEYWASDAIKLIQPETADLLRGGGYPEFGKCVLCDRLLVGGYDWWDLDGVSGPCCSYRSGCQQVQVSAN